MSEQTRKSGQGKPAKLPRYGWLYFAHLQSEYDLVAHSITDAAQQECLKKIHAKKDENLLTWDDICLFAQLIAKHQDLDTLKGKLCVLRTELRSITTAAEYEQFSALRTPDLAQVTPQIEQQVRSEYHFLIGEFCLRYSFIAAREEFRLRLMRWGTLLTLFFFLLAALIGVFALKNQNSALGSLAYGFSTLTMVVFAGVTGAFVSMQQRIQSIPNRGDPIFNLSLLIHGWFGIFLSPLTGAIFAIILYLFFAGGLLKGNIFPNVQTPPQPPVINIDARVEGTPSAPEGSPISSSVGTASPTPTPVSSPTLSFSQRDTTDLTYFLKHTGPIAGTDYALLLIWSFIAGFAERFVPDSLMRLVNQNETKAKSETEVAK